MDQILGDCDRLGIRIMTIQDAIYPERLRAIHQPPLVLYWKGRDIAVDNEAAVAVVGTRSATPYGVRIAEQLGLDLTRAGALVVSGIAEGIDAAAVRGALQGRRAGDLCVGRRHRLHLSQISPGPVCRCSGGRGACVRVSAGNGEPEQPFPSAQPDYQRLVPGCCGGGESPHRRQPDHRRTRPGPGSGGLCRPRTDGRAKQRGHQSPDSGGAAKLILDAEDVVCEFADRFPDKFGRSAALSGEARKQRLENLSGCAGPAQARPSSPGKRVDNPAKLEYIDWKNYKNKLTDDQRDILLALGEGPPGG